MPEMNAVGDSKKLRRIGRAAIALGVLLLASPNPARATADTGTFHFGPTLGYSFPIEEARFNGLGVGLGLRAGATLPWNIYLGLLGEFHIGDSIPLETATVRVQSHLLMQTIGYDMRIPGSMIIRPTLGYGLEVRGVLGCGPGLCTSTVDTERVWTAALQLVTFPKHGLYLAPEIRYVGLQRKGSPASLSLLLGLGGAIDF